MTIMIMMMIRREVTREEEKEEEEEAEDDEAERPAIGRALDDPGGAQSLKNDPPLLIMTKTTMINVDLAGIEPVVTQSRLQENEGIGPSRTTDVIRNKGIKTSLYRSDGAILTVEIVADHSRMTDIIANAADTLETEIAIVTETEIVIETETETETETTIATVTESERIDER